jgi:hypothetical protein
MRRLIVLAVTSLMLTVPQVFAQQDVPVFTDRDIERGDGSTMTLTGTEETPDGAGAPTYSQFDRYVRGDRVDIRWLELSDIQPAFRVYPREDPEEPGGVYYTGPVEFFVRSLPDAPAGKNLEVLYAFECYNKGGGVGNYEEYTFLITPADFVPRTEDGRYGLYEKKVRVLLDYEADEFTNTSWNIYLVDITIK